MDNLTDFEMPSQATALNMDGGQHQGHTSFFFPESLGGVHQQPIVVEPFSSNKPSSENKEEGDDDSSATESADSEREMDPLCHAWELRRFSSSPVHSREDTDTEALERRQFMKAYVKKVFHGK